jgi:hypothetical protein
MTAPGAACGWSAGGGLPSPPGQPSYEGPSPPDVSTTKPPVAMKPPAPRANVESAGVPVPTPRPEASARVTHKVTRRCWTAVLQLRAPTVQSVDAPGILRARLPHNGVLKDIATIHRRTGVTNPLVFRTLTQSALGIGKILARSMQRFQSSASSLSATKRTAIRREARDSLYSDPPPGTHASVDLTHFFERNSDGYVCTAIILGRSTWSLWLGPMKNKTCSEFVRVLEEFQLHVRAIHGVELREVRPTTHVSRTIGRALPTTWWSWTVICGTCPRRRPSCSHTPLLRLSL